jgi:hypothetical protein
LPAGVEADPRRFVGAARPEIEKHLAACAACAAELGTLRELAAEARDLPAPPGMSNESRAAISARLLAAPPEPPRRETASARGAILLTAGAATVILAIAVVVLPVVRRGASPEEQASTAPPPTPVSASVPRTSRASIRAIGDARFFRAQPPPDEIVRLDDGRIELDVIPLAAGERFRVVTDHGRSRFGNQLRGAGLQRQPAVGVGVARARRGAIGRPLGPRRR